MPMPKLHLVSKTLFSALGLAFAFTLGVANAYAVTTVATNQFASSSDLTSWGFGSQAGATVTLSTNKSLGYNGNSGSIVGSYPTPTGNNYIWGGYDISALKTNDIYIEFWAKMPKAKYGLKFLKIFGGRDATGYANTTFGLDYTGVDYGSMYQVSFGDGSGTSNDTANVINLDGSYPNWIGRSYGTATVLTPQKSRWASSNWGTSWHHFKIHAKFNSGTSAATEVADGAYYVEIDGKVYVDAKGLLNRHYSNLPIQNIALFGWSQGGTTPFEIWYSNVTLSTGGFVTSTTLPSTAAPSAPAAFSATPK